MADAGLRRSSRSGRRPRATARWCRSSTSRSTARTRRVRLRLRRATSSTAPASTRPLERDRPTRTRPSTRSRTAALKVTTVAGDIRAGRARGTCCSSRADHAGAGLGDRDEALGHDQDGYQQGGLSPRATTPTTSSSTRSPTTGRPDQPDRAALRGRRASSGPQPQLRRVPTGTTKIWLRLTKTGTTYTGRVLVRRDDLDALRRRRAERRWSSPRFGLYTVGVNAPAAR